MPKLSSSLGQVSASCWKRWCVQIQLCQLHAFMESSMNSCFRQQNFSENLPALPGSLMLKRELNQKLPNPYLVRIVEPILSLTKYSFNLSVVRTAAGWYNFQCNYISINLLTVAGPSLLNFELGGGTQVF